MSESVSNHACDVSEFFLWWNRLSFVSTLENHHMFRKVVGGRQRISVMALSASWKVNALAGSKVSLFKMRKSGHESPVPPSSVPEAILPEKWLPFGQDGPPITSVTSQGCDVTSWNQPHFTEYEEPHACWRENECEPACWEWVHSCLFFSAEWTATKFPVP